jgi:Ca2+-binding RTX toxin-like protein
MHPSRSLRRLVLGAAVAGAAIGALPAMASASSTCSYNFNTKEVTINDASGSLALHVVRSGPYVAYGDGRSTPQICWGPVTIATTTNTDTINVIESAANVEGGITVDESQGMLAPGATPESDGTSEIETVVYSNHTHPSLKVVGTSGPDTIRVGGSGAVNLGPDADTDISVADGASNVALWGGAGNDFLSGEGFVNGVWNSATVPLLLVGEADNDVLLGGFASDALYGGANDDSLISVDLSSDTLSGDTGDDTAKLDSKDILLDTIEHTSIG